MTVIYTKVWRYIGTQTSESIPTFLISLHCSVDGGGFLFVCFGEGRGCLFCFVTDASSTASVRLPISDTSHSQVVKEFSV